MASSCDRGSQRLKPPHVKKQMTRGNFNHREEGEEKQPLTFSAFDFFFDVLASRRKFTFWRAIRKHHLLEEFIFAS